MRLPIFRVFRAAALCAFVALAAFAPASAQQACRDIQEIVVQCPATGTISGNPPDCQCDGIPLKPPPLTCERNFGCADDTFVGQGKFPECVCRKQDKPAPGGGSGGGRDGRGGLGSSLGGGATCEQFFVCPDGFKMDAAGGLCQCLLTMQPALKK